MRGYETADYLSETGTSRISFKIRDCRSELRFRKIEVRPAFSMDAERRGSFWEPFFGSPEAGLEGAGLTAGTGNGGGAGVLGGALRASGFETFSSISKNSRKLRGTPVSSVGTGSDGVCGRAGGADCGDGAGGAAEGRKGEGRLSRGKGRSFFADSAAALRFSARTRRAAATSTIRLQTQLTKAMKIITT